MNLLNVVSRLKDKQIAVIGDMIADVYLYGRISRISREAPVLVLEEEREDIVAGGAANVVHNACTLGGKVYAVGVLGDDRIGHGLQKMLAAKDICTDGLLLSNLRPTITKTRVIAGGAATVSQQIVRLDREPKTELEPAMELEIKSFLQTTLRHMDGVVLSDYGSGTLTPELIRLVLTVCREYGIPTIVDSRYRIFAFAGCTYVKQNDSELAEAMKRQLTNVDELVAAAGEMLQRMQAQGVLVTRGGEGMTLVEADGRVTHIPVSDVSEVYDVSGAGDTCVAAMILGVAGGVEPAEAARISNFASGVAVRKFGTATVTLAELTKVIGDYEIAHK